VGESLETVLGIVTISLPKMFGRWAQTVVSFCDLTGKSIDFSDDSSKDANLFCWVWYTLGPGLLTRIVALIEEKPSGSTLSCFLLREFEIAVRRSERLAMRLFFAIRAGQERV